MLYMPLPHGSAGILDEVLECGGLLLIVLLVYFFNAARKRTGVESPADGAASHAEGQVTQVSVHDEQ